MNEWALELRIAKLLRAGVLASAAFLLIGWVFGHAQREPIAHFTQYFPAPVLSSVREAWGGRQWGLMSCYVGLGILVVLPAVRVLLTGLLFVKSKEYAMAGLALFVLAALVLSFSFGMTGH